MKYFQHFFFFVFFLNYSIAANAQHKIIWEMGSGDTAQQRVLFNQVNNVLNEVPDTKIELVIHGFAVYAMLKDTGYLKQMIISLDKKGVVFAF